MISKQIKNLHNFSQQTGLTKIPVVYGGLANTSYANLPRNAIVKLPHPRSRYRQETFLAPSAEKQTRNYDIGCSTHYPSQTDKPDLNKKGIEVNNALKEMCEEKNIFLIDHSKKLKASHLNNSRLHLNRKGDQILGNIFTQHILKIFN